MRLAIFGISVLIAANSLNAQIIVENRPLLPEDIAAEASLTAYLDVPKQFIVERDEKALGVPVSVLNASFKDTIPPPHNGVLALSAWKPIGDRDVTTRALSLKEGTVPNPEYFSILVNSGVLTGKVETIWPGSGPVQVLTFDPKIAAAYLRVKERLSGVQAASPDTSREVFGLVNAQYGSIPTLRKAVELPLAQISFGRPLVETSAEKNLNVPQSIAEEFEVYWVEFPMSIRDLPDNTCDSIRFVIDLPANAIAFELLPLRLGTERKVEEKRSAPAGKLSIGPNAVEIGQVWGQTVTFTSVKPTIVANGLGESSIEWLLTNEAVELGAKRFASIIGVPKTMRSIEVAMAAFATLPSMLISYKVAGTETKKVAITLPLTR